MTGAERGAATLWQLHRAADQIQIEATALGGTALVNVGPIEWRDRSLGDGVVDRTLGWVWARGDMTGPRPASAAAGDQPARLSLTQTLGDFSLTEPPAQGPAAGASEVIVICRLRATPGARGHLLSALQPFIEIAAAEPATLGFAFHLVRTEPDLLVLLERYADESAFATHIDRVAPLLADEHGAVTGGRQLANLLAEPPVNRLARRLLVPGGAADTAGSEFP